MSRLAVSTRAARWTLAPALLLLMVMVGLAVGSESRSEFEAGLDDGSETSDELSEQPSPEPQDQDQELDSTPAGDAGQDQEISPDLEPADAGPEISLEVRGGDGTVGVRLDPTGADVAFPRTSDGASGLPTELTPDGLPPGSGFRLSDDGRLEVVAIDEADQGDIVLDPTPVGGVDLTADDGSRVEIRTEPGEADGPGTISLTAVDSDGTATPLVADGDGAIDVGDDITIQLPTSGGQIPPAEDPIQIPWRWFALWILSMVLASLALASYLWRKAPPLPFSDHFQAPAEVPVTRFVDFLTVLRMDPDPARAIRLAFEGAERGLGSLPPREPTETPFEWHARIAADHSHLDAVLGSLCSRFTTARFAPERPSSNDRDAAVNELEQLAYLAGYHELPARTTIELVGGRK